MNNCSSGQITNLLANDANKIETLHYFIQYLWVSNNENAYSFDEKQICLDCSIANHCHRFFTMAFYKIRHIRRHWIHSVASIDSTDIESCVSSSTVGSFFV